MKKAILFKISVLLLFINVSKVHAQDMPNPLLDMGVELYNLGTYGDALDIFLQVLEENPDNAKANLYVGKSYLFSVSEKPKAVNYLLKANELSPNVSRDIHFLIAEGYRYGFKFEEAKNHYDKFTAYVVANPTLFNDGRNYEKIALHRKEQCDNAIELTATPVDVDIKNLGKTINSPFADYAPTISENEDMLIFTSRRSESTGGLKDLDNKYFEDIYISKKEDSSWTKPQNISENINSASHESNIGLSRDGSKLFIYTAYNGGDIYVSELKGDQWSKPKSVGLNVNSTYKETSAYLSKDGTKLFFSSNRQDGVGRMDIYVSELNAEGEWDVPANIGGEINTEYDEESPYFDEESNTLYFSSKGHKSMGGYDIFKSTFDPDHEKWSEPENLGFPINTPDDDIYMVVTQDGKRGYYSSHKADSYGENDICVVSFEQKEEKIVHEDTTIKKEGVNLKIKVVEANTREMFKGALVQVVDRHTDKVLYEKHSISGEVAFHFKQSEPTQLLVYAESPGYKYRGVLVEIPAAGDTLVELTETILMKEYEVNKPYILRNVYFGFDHSHLKPESKYEIDKIRKMLIENPDMVIQISGHTDYVGSAAYNMELSTKRATAVVDYLIAQGIDKHRVKAQGYGKTRPIASNDDEAEGRELNRRTEIVILKK